VNALSKELAMRSGIIAKKLGMTRIFTDAGDDA